MMNQGKMMLAQGEGDRGNEAGYRKFDTWVKMDLRSSDSGRASNVLTENVSRLASPRVSCNWNYFLPSVKVK